MARVAHQDAVLAARSAAQLCDVMVAELSRVLINTLQTHGISYVTEALFVNVAAYNTCASLINASDFATRLDLSLPLAEDPAEIDDSAENQAASSPIAADPAVAMATPDADERSGEDSDHSVGTKSGVENSDDAASATGPNE